MNGLLGNLFSSPPLGFGFAMRQEDYLPIIAEQHQRQWALARKAANDPGIYWTRTSGRTHRVEIVR